MQNPYIELSRDDENIMQDLDLVYSIKSRWSEYFKNQNPIHLEIGTGFGNFFALNGSRDDGINYIGMEIKYKRIYKTSEKSKKLGVKNYLLIKDFGQNISKIFGPGEISKTYVFFPDPGHKKLRQHKHKLFQADFLENLYNITSIGGKLIFKTDHLEYFDDTIDIIKSQNLWTIDYLTHNYEEDRDLFDTKNITEFEGFFRGEGIDINYLELIKK